MQSWGGSNKRRELKSVIFVVVVSFLLILLADSLLMKTNPLIPIASAPPREFEKDITIPSNEFYILELGFSEGDELELIFSLEVEQSLPIDVWFVNYANYVRLVDGNEFLYFIDGSGQEITQAQKVVSVTQLGTYILVLANYNNATVDVNLTYDINVYPEEEETVSLWKEPYIMLPLGLIIGILVGFLAFHISHRSGKGAPKTAAKAPSKKADIKKSQKAKPKAAEKTIAKKKAEKVKKKEPVLAKKTTAEEVEEVESGEAEEKPKAAEKVHSTRFCGHCGKPVETKFCPFCGKEAKTD